MYPSAFHVRWSPPPDCDHRPIEQRRHPYVASLAVDVELKVFWDGVNPDPGELLERWKVAVKFTDTWGTVQIGHNGPSGDGLITEYLRPLGLAQGDVAMTDAVPWYFVKGGAGSQGAAIERVNSLAAKLGFDPAQNLPARPSTTKLVEIAGGPARRESLRRELVEIGAPLLITLGQEGLDAVRGVADEVSGVQGQLAHAAGYGTEGTLVIDALQPRAHLGLISQAAEASVWRAAHATWGGARDVRALVVANALTDPFHPAEWAVRNRPPPLATRGQMVHLFAAVGPFGRCGARA